MGLNVAIAIWGNNGDKVSITAMEKFIKDELKLDIKLKGEGKVGESMCIIETESLTDKHNTGEEHIENPRGACVL